MNWTWQEIAAFCAVLGLVWEVVRRITNTLRAQALALRENALAQVRADLAKSEAQKKALADKQRTEALWALVEIHSQLIEGIHDHLSLPPKERETQVFHVRKATKNLEKLGFDRLENYHTDIT